MDHGHRPCHRPGRLVTGSAGIGRLSSDVCAGPFPEAEAPDGTALIGDSASDSPVGYTMGRITLPGPARALPHGQRWGAGACSPRSGGGRGAGAEEARGFCRPARPTGSTDSHRPPRPRRKKYRTFSRTLRALYEKACCVKGQRGGPSRSSTGPAFARWTILLSALIKGARLGAPVPVGVRIPLLSCQTP